VLCLRTLASALEERVLERTDELERRRAQLEAIVEQFPVGLIIVDASSRRAVTMNDEAVRIMGCLDGSTDQLPLERALVHGEIVHDERLEFRPSGRSVFTIQFSAVPVRDRSGLIVSAAASIQDISAHDRRERAERDFVTNAAHELQGPLAAITSAVEVLQAGAKETEERDLFLGHIESEALRLGRITRSLLTLARTQTGVEPPRAELIELCPMLRAIADRMKPAEGVELTVACPKDLGVLANRDLLEQAISNLVRNAVKHTDRGSIRIIGSARGARVAIKVADTGRGIAPEALPRVFDRFYRSDPQHEGFGLGLAIVHASVEVMNGELGLESKLGEGTNVSIELPAKATIVSP
jgi:two-component system phosphate regulon sensor histidine kinase PhoR